MGGRGGPGWGRGVGRARGERGGAGGRGGRGEWAGGRVGHLPQVPTRWKARTEFILGSFGWLRLAGLPVPDRSLLGKAGRRKLAVSGQGAHLTLRHRFPSAHPTRWREAARDPFVFHFGGRSAPICVWLSFPVPSVRPLLETQMSQQTKIDPLQGGLCGPQTFSRSQ